MPMFDPHQSGTRTLLGLLVLGGALAHGHHAVA